jgi:site-specific DNA-methyltransferase (adenine-specific)
MSAYTLHHGDCLDILPTLAPGSVDAVIADIPTGATDCDWDRPLDLAAMWNALKPTVAPNAPIVLLGVGSLQYAAHVVASNPAWFRYEWLWSKNRPSGHGYAKYRPMRSHEYVLVFCGGELRYTPQMTRRTDAELKTKSYMSTPTAPTNAYQGMKYGNTTTRDKSVFKFPKSVLEFKCVHPNDADKTKHTSQKPQLLLEYLVKTYTNAGDLVLDFCFGSGTTGAACGNLGRAFVGIEKDLNYFTLGSERIATAYAPLRMMQAAAVS